MKSYSPQAFGDTFQMSSSERVAKTSTLLQTRAHEHTPSRTNLPNSESTAPFRTTTKSQTEDNSPDKADHFLFKECSFSDFSTSSRPPSSSEPATSIKSWKGFSPPRSRRYYDGPQSLRRLRLDRLQINDHVLTEMALSTPGRISPRNVPKSPVLWSDSMECLTPSSRKSGLSEFEEEDEEEGTVIGGNEFPALTDNDVAYMDSWACRTPRLSAFSPCDTIDEVEGES